MLRLKYSIILLLVLSLPLIQCKRGSSGGRGFGGGGGGGPSAARANPASGGVNQQSGGFGGPPQQGGNFGRPYQQGGNPQQPQPNYGGAGFNGQRPGGGFNQPHGQPGMTGGFGSSAAKYAVGGLIGGALLGSLGTYALTSLHRDQPVSAGNMNYYLDQDHFKAKSGEFMCSMPFEELVKPNAANTTAPATSGDAATTPTPEKALSEAKFVDGSRPKHLVWGCKQGVEVCCEGKCCPAPPQNHISSGAMGKSGGGGMGAGTIALLFLASYWLSCYCAVVFA